MWERRKNGGEAPHISNSRESVIIKILLLGDVGEDLKQGCGGMGRESFFWLLALLCVLFFGGLI